MKIKSAVKLIISAVLLVIVILSLLLFYFDVKDADKASYYHEDYTIERDLTYDDIVELESNQTDEKIELFYEGTYLSGARITSDQADSNYAIIYERGDNTYEMLDTNGDGAYDEVMNNYDRGPYGFSYIHSKARGIVQQGSDSYWIWLTIALSAFIVLLVMLIKFRPRMMASILVLFLIFSHIPKVLANDHLFNSNGTIDETYFNANWQKYSSISDDSLPRESKSYEVQKIEELQELLEDLWEEYIACQYDIGRYTEEINILTEDRNNLKLDHQINIVRCIIRLAVITGQTINSGKGYQSSVESIADLSSTTVKVLKETASLAGNFIPDFEEKKAKDLKESAATTQSYVNKAFDYTEQLTTKGLDYTATAAVGDLVQTSVKEAESSLDLPSVDITKEDLNILSKSKEFLALWNKKITKLSQQRAESRVELDELAALSVEIMDEIESLKETEKNNLRLDLIESYEKNKDNEEETAIEEEISVEPSESVNDNSKDVYSGVNDIVISVLESSSENMPVGSTINQSMYIELELIKDGDKYLLYLPDEISDITVTEYDNDNPKVVTVKEINTISCAMDNNHLYGNEKGEASYKDKTFTYDITADLMLDHNKLKGTINMILNIHNPGLGLDSIENRITIDLAK